MTDDDFEDEDRLSPTILQPTRPRQKIDRRALEAAVADQISAGLARYRQECGRQDVEAVQIDWSIDVEHVRGLVHTSDDHGFPVSVPIALVAVTAGNA